VLLERLENLVRVEIHVSHHLTEHVPLDLGEAKTDMLVGEQGMIAATCLVQGAIDYSFG
jgi:hypothetical protein